jgi:hypothetical protein
VFQLVPYVEQFQILEAAEFGEKDDVLRIFGGVGVPQDWIADDNGWAELLEGFKHVARGLTPNARGEARDVLIVQRTHVLGHMHHGDGRWLHGARCLQCWDGRSSDGVWEVGGLANDAVAPPVQREVDFISEDTCHRSGIDTEVERVLDMA